MNFNQEDKVMGKSCPSPPPPLFFLIHKEALAAED